METTIAEISSRLGQKVEIRGWCYNFRSSGKIAFLQLRDGTGRIQGVAVRDQVNDPSWEVIGRLTIESSVVVRGEVKEDKRSPTGFELSVEEIEPLQIAEEYPIGKKEHGPDFLLNYRHLWIRSERQSSVLRVRDTIEFALREFMRKEGFVLTDSPIFTPSACEGTTELFEVKYFEDKAYLSQSGQLYLEATSASLRRTYDFGPVFRSEKSKTRRHLTEFWMLDAEASFMDWSQNMDLQEKMVSFVMSRVLDERSKELQALERDTSCLERTAQGGFQRLDYDEAVERLNRLGSDIKLGEDFGGDDETLLTKEFDRPVFVHHYPAEIKAFYMEPDSERPDRVLCNDLLAPEGYGEIIGGSQRISDRKLLEQRMRDHNLPPEAMGWYLDLRRYGSVPHSGFGLGLERMVAWCCGLDHVRETIPFPRLLNRVSP